jgi:hypothetical protein
MLRGATLATGVSTIEGRLQDERPPFRRGQAAPLVGRELEAARAGRPTSKE